MIFKLMGLIFVVYCVYLWLRPCSINVNVTNYDTLLDKVDQGYGTDDFKRK